MSLRRTKAAVTLLALAALFLPAPSALAADAPLPPATRAAIDAAFTKAFAETKAPGRRSSASGFPGEGAYVATRGVSDTVTKTPMLVADHFRVGSITKTFTATLLLILADEKKLGLDDPVSKYAAWVPNGDKITLRMLADMTSGLHNYTEVDAWDKDHALQPQARVDAARAGRRGHQASARLPAGAGLALQQHQLRAARHDPRAGRPARRSRTASPRRSSSRSSSRKRRGPSAAALPKPYAHGTTVQSIDNKLADATHRDPTWAFTAGELISTMADLHTWVVSYTTGSLVSPEMQKQRLTWMTMPPMTPEHAYGIGIGIDHGWLGHTGELPGYNCSAYYLPDEEGGDRRDGEHRYSGRQDQPGADDYEGAGAGGDAGERAAVNASQHGAVRRVPVVRYLATSRLTIGPEVSAAPPPLAVCTCTL